MRMANHVMKTNKHRLPPLAYFGRFTKLQKKYCLLFYFLLFLSSGVKCLNFYITELVSGCLYFEKIGADLSEFPVGKSLYWIRDLTKTLSIHVFANVTKMFSVS